MQRFKLMKCTNADRDETDRLHVPSFADCTIY